MKIVIIILLISVAINIFLFLFHNGPRNTSPIRDSISFWFGKEDEEDENESIENKCDEPDYEKMYYDSKADINDTKRARLLLKTKFEVENRQLKMTAPVKILAANGGARCALFSHYINSDENSILEHVNLCSIGAENTESRFPHFKLYDSSCPNPNWKELIKSKKVELDSFFGDETQIVIFVQTAPYPYKYWDIRIYNNWQAHILDYLRNRNIALVGILTLPFMFEGQIKRERGILYISKIEEYFDTFYIYDAKNLEHDNQFEFLNYFPKLHDTVGPLIDETLCLINTYTTDGKVNIPRIIYEINKARNYVSLHEWKLVKEHEMRPDMGLPRPPFLKYKRRMS